MIFFWGEGKQNFPPPLQNPYYNGHIKIVEMNSIKNSSNRHKIEPINFVHDHFFYCSAN